MSQFLTETTLTILRGQFREGRQLYRLEKPLVYESELLGVRVIVPGGFVTDLASVPKLPLTWLIAGGTAHEPAVVHDWLYTTHAVHGKAITRAQADAVFREAIGVSEDPGAPGWMMWAAVRAGGSSSWGAEGPVQKPAVARVIEIEAP